MPTRCAGGNAPESCELSATSRGAVGIRTSPETARPLTRGRLITVFGAGGDLAWRKLVPALYSLFVDRWLGGPTGKESSYQFHALFRAFLRRKARAVFDAVELAVSRRALARLLRQGDAIEDAFTLLVEASDWEGAAEVIYVFYENDFHVN